jgi:hypothetical protein
MPGVRKLLVGLLIIGVLLAFVPPFLTRGSCTAEFDAVTDAWNGIRAEFATLARAEAYLRARAQPYRLLPAERCDSFPTREDVIVCPGGAVLLIALPVRNPVCRYYRDRSIRLQLGFNTRQQLVHVQTDMHAYGILRLRLVGFELYWAR